MVLLMNPLTVALKIDLCGWACFAVQIHRLVLHNISLFRFNEEVGQWLWRIRWKSFWKLMKKVIICKEKKRIKIQLADTHKNFMKIIKAHSFWIKCYLRSIPKLRLRCIAVSRLEEIVLYILSILSSLWCDRVVHVHSLGSVLCYHHWQYQQQSFVLVLGRVACKTTSCYWHKEPQHLSGAAGKELSQWK